MKYKKTRDPSSHIGERYNHLEIIGFKYISDKKDKRRCVYECFCHRCKKQKEKPTLLKTLKNGNTKSCGCLQKDAMREAKTKDKAEYEKHIGEIKHWIKITGISKIKTKTKRVVYECTCLRCGNSHLITYSNFGKTQSCGCLRSDERKKSMEEYWEKRKSSDKYNIIKSL